VFEDLDVNRLMTFAEKAIDLMTERYFGWKALCDPKPNWFAFYPCLWNEHNELQLMLPS